MNQSAIVKKEVRSGVVEVSLLRQVECGLSCGGDCAGCMQKPKGEILALASNPIGAKPGERVEVEATSGSSIGIALLMVTFVVVEYCNFGIYLPVSATMALIALPLSIILFRNPRTQE